jgi:hypothetical protein
MILIDRRNDRFTCTRLPLINTPYQLRQNIRGGLFHFRFGFLVIFKTSSRVVKTKENISAEVAVICFVGFWITAKQFPSAQYFLKNFSYYGEVLVAAFLWIPYFATRPKSVLNLL